MLSSIILIYITFTQMVRHRCHWFCFWQFLLHECNTATVALGWWIFGSTSSKWSDATLWLPLGRRMSVYLFAYLSMRLTHVTIIGIDIFKVDDEEERVRKRWQAVCVDEPGLTMGPGLSPCHNILCSDWARIILLSRAPCYLPPILQLCELDNRSGLDFGLGLFGRVAKFSTIKKFLKRTKYIAM